MRAALASLILLTAPPARACFDGYAGNVGRVSFTRSMGHDGVDWTPALVRDVATWGARIDALLPRGMKAEIDSAGVRTCRGDSACPVSDKDPPWKTDSLRSTFWSVASQVHGDTRRALAVEQPVFTVQVFAARDRKTADRIAESFRQIDYDRDLHGFVYVGGFPGDSAIAHTIAGPDGLVRVVTGAFLTWKDAAKARAAWLPHFKGAFVRAL